MNRSVSVSKSAVWFLGEGTSWSAAFPMFIEAMQREKLAFAINANSLSNPFKVSIPPAAPRPILDLNSPSGSGSPAPSADSVSAQATPAATGRVSSINNTSTSTALESPPDIQRQSPGPTAVVFSDKDIWLFESQIWRDQENRRLAEIAKLDTAKEKWIVARSQLAGYFTGGLSPEYHSTLMKIKAAWMADPANSHLEWEFGVMLDLAMREWGSATGLASFGSLLAVSGFSLSSTDTYKGSRLSELAVTIQT